MYKILSQCSPGKHEHRVNHHLSSFEPAQFQLIIYKPLTEGGCLSPAHGPDGRDEGYEGLIISELRHFDGLTHHSSNSNLVLQEVCPLPAD